MLRSILLSSFLVSITLGSPNRRILDIQENKKIYDRRAVKCLTNPGSNCGPTLKTLWKNVELDNVVEKMLKKNIENKMKIAKIFLKSYVKKYSKTPQEKMEITLKFNHIFKII